MVDLLENIAYFEWKPNTTNGNMNMKKKVVDDVYFLSVVNIISLLDNSTSKYLMNLLNKVKRRKK